MSLRIYLALLSVLSYTMGVHHFIVIWIMWTGLLIMRVICYVRKKINLTCDLLFFQFWAEQQQSAYHHNTLLGCFWHGIHNHCLHAISVWRKLCRHCLQRCLCGKPSYWHNYSWLVWLRSDVNGEINMSLLEIRFICRHSANLYKIRRYD